MVWNIRKPKTKTKTLRTTRKKRRRKNEDSVSSLWDDFKRSSIHIIGVPEGKQKEQERKST